jgi:hypothetical protein
MLKLTRNRKARVSNRLAIVAAMMLGASAFIGMDRPLGPDSDQAMLAGSTGTATSSQEQTATARSTSAERGKSFKVSLLILRLR